MLAAVTTDKIQVKFARIVRVGTSSVVDTSTKACESCEYSSSSSSSSSDPDDSYESYRMSSESAVELEIPVWVGGTEKWVTGLTKRTTCDDVIYALMTFQDGGGVGGPDAAELQSYALYERWREVERPLRGRTKILKVWRAWGSESRNVRFFVKKVDNPYESGSEIMRPRRTRRRADRDAGRRERHDSRRHRERSRRRYAVQEREDRRMRRRSSRSTEHLWDDFDVGCDADVVIPSHAKYPTADDPGLAPGGSTGRRPDHTKSRLFHEMVQLILDQEKRIRDQADRIRDTEAEIEQRETAIHMARVQNDGKNYVTESYLPPADPERRGTGGAGAAETRTEPELVIRDEAEVDAYEQLCDKILNIQERICREEEKIDHLTKAIFAELHADNSDNFSLASGYDGSPAKRDSRDPEAGRVSAEVARLRGEIERSLALSAAQRRQLELVEETLGQCETQIRRKSLYVNQLVLELSERRADDDSMFGITTSQMLTRLKSRSCEMLARAPLMPPLDSDSQIADFRYNSDSGVESVDNKPEVELSEAKHDVNVSPKSDPGFEDDLLFATTSTGRKMVPYFTYASYDKESRDRPPLPGAKSNTSDDSNSDTGLSSLHSDETSSPVLETLV